MKIKKTWDILKNSSMHDKDMQRAFQKAATPNACVELLEENEQQQERIKELEQSQPKWVSVEEFLDKQESEQHCWIVFKGQVKNAYFYKGMFNFAQLSATAYLTECISAVMPIREPQPPEVSDDE